MPGGRPRGSTACAAIAGGRRGSEDDLLERASSEWTCPPGNGGRHLPYRPPRPCPVVSAADLLPTARLRAQGPQRGPSTAVDRLRWRVSPSAQRGPGRCRVCTGPAPRRCAGLAQRGARPTATDSPTSSVAARLRQRRHDPASPVRAPHVEYENPRSNQWPSVPARPQTMMLTAMIYLACTPTEGTAVHVGDPEELAEVRWPPLVDVVARVHRAGGRLMGRRDVRTVREAARHDAACGRARPAGRAVRVECLCRTGSPCRRNLCPRSPGTLTFWPWSTSGSSGGKP